MKMPENMTPLAAILAAKECIGAILRCVGVPSRQIASGHYKTVIDATMCAIIAQFIRDLLDFAGLGSNLAYITSVLIGYIGIDSIGLLIKRFAAKKAGVEDAEINNRKAFLDMLARGLRELITDVRKPEISGYDVIGRRAIY